MSLCTVILKGTAVILRGTAKATFQLYTMTPVHMGRMEILDVFVFSPMPESMDPVNNAVPLYHVQSTAGLRSPIRQR